MLTSLFDQKSCVMHLQYSEFLENTKKGQIQDIVLSGYKDKGFFIAGRIKGAEHDITCILVTQHSEIRYIKCPDNAHTFLYSMGINEFMVDTTSWDMESTFNPHKVSQQSRLRKKRRERALRNRPVYLDKFRFAYNDVQIEERIKILVECAVKQGWLEKSKIISKKRFFTWIDKKELPDKKKVPTWAMKSAALLATDKKVYPRNELEISVFACLWSSIYGPFESVDCALESLPGDFMNKISSQNIDKSCVEIAMADEVIHARFVKQQERLFQESKVTEETQVEQGTQVEQSAFDNL
ncbi:hypothetical protein [Microbulbifer epialgicus]|uniref:Uncharacterized protein n=1 Tax=Microbulbifer epialgicus TaxID=393907 RepID=A0ABV4NTV0_9GAMM